MSEVKLLPCPFCGGKAKVIRRKKSSNDDGFLFEVSVKCEVCDSESRRCLEDENKAIMIWNTRKPMERIIEKLEGKSRFYNSASAVDQNIRRSVKESIDIVKEQVKTN
jgi:Lar family restriction alleviation protein